MKKITLAFVLFGIILAIFSFLRSALDFLPYEGIDAAMWFLSGPVAWIGMYFGLPEAAFSVPLVIYYLILGVIFGKLAQYSNKKFYIGIAVCALVILHYVSAGEAAKILGKVLEDIMRGLFLRRK